MARVYMVLGDVGNYQSLLWDGKVTDERMAMTRFDGTPKADTWVPPPVWSDTPTWAAPDIWTLQRSTLVFPPSAREKLGQVLDNAGELLPLPFNGETWHLLNVLPPYNSLDADASTWRAIGNGQKLMKLAFHPDRLPDTLFKIPERTVSTLCVEGLRSREDEFKAVVEDLGLTGLIFKPLWDSDDPLIFEAQSRW